MDLCKYMTSLMIIKSMSWFYNDIGWIGATIQVLTQWDNMIYNIDPHWE